MNKIYWMKQLKGKTKRRNWGHISISWVKYLAPNKTKTDWNSVRWGISIFPPPWAFPHFTVCTQQKQGWLLLPHNSIALYEVVFWVSFAVCRCACHVYHLKSQWMSLVGFLQKQALSQGFGCKWLIKKGPTHTPGKAIKGGGKARQEMGRSQAKVWFHKSHTQPAPNWEILLEQRTHLNLSHHEGKE